MRTSYKTAEYTCDPRLAPDLRFIVGSSLIVVFLTYRAFNDLFYLNWIFGTLALAVAFGVVTVTSRTIGTLLKTLLPTTAWVAVAVSLTPFATNTSHHLKIGLVSVFYIIASLGMVEILYRSRSTQGRLFDTVLYTWVFINSVLLFLFFVGIYEPRKGDFSGVFHDRNVFSITTVILLTLSFGLSGFRIRRMKHPWISVISVVISSGMILTSKSITGLLCLGLLLAHLYFFSSRRGRRTLLLMVSLAVLTLVVVPNPISARVERFTIAAMGRTEALNINESAYIRPYLIREGITLFSERPIVGVGLDNARFHVSWPGRETGSFLHNTYLDIATSIGVVGFSFYYLPIVWALWKASKISREVKGKNRESSRYPLLTASALLSLKLVYDLTWTTYFEFGMVFSVIFAIYTVVHYQSLQR